MHVCTGCYKGEEGEGMVAIVFEDNDETPSSVLLKSLPCGGSLYFSKGNWLLKNKVEELLELQKFDRIIVYVDLVMDNPETIAIYEELVDLRENERWKCVKIIPILCIEYFICKALVKRDVLDIRGVKSIVDNMVLNCSFSQVDSKMCGKSHEKTLKKVFLDNKSRCYRNTINKANSIYGKFYLADCDCDPKFCYKQCIGLSQSIKAAYIYSELPIIVLDDDTTSILGKLGINIRQVDYDVVQLNIQEQYNRIAKDMGLPDSEYIEIII